MEHTKKAAELFVNGYNCAQAVAVAFCDVTGLDEDLTAKIASAYGGGVGGLREVCGAVSAMALVLGHLYGYSTPEDNVGKKEIYATVQELAAQFQHTNGSVICRQLLENMPGSADLTPEEVAYCAKRPCARMVITAARLLDEFISQHPAAK